MTTPRPSAARTVRPAQHPQLASPVTTAAGGGGLAVAAALQMAAGLHVLGLLGPSDSHWALAASIVGAAVMLVASVVLGNSRAGMPGIVGGSVVGRVALVAFGADGLLGLTVSGIAVAGGSNRLTALVIGFSVARVLGATTVTTVAVARERRTSGAVSGTLLLIVLCDLVSVALLLALPTPSAFLASAYLARPALLAVLGAFLILQALRSAAKAKLHV